ncbi:heme utilization protein HutZ [Oceanimonas sp. CHS3-5]|uniref:heme utilization protein HutZ n=1 Tax=Oceanimonas sp. CHS3-5 TaxID=3068186 RepID=UPI00273F9359|nr:heme utilization protein HutZ [Oceanimonas sp. CHS3-5]MDP5292339.1 heme utilization protein HutZ [Oceanimonas sp. CHS3-5]
MVDNTEKQARRQGRLAPEMYEFRDSIKTLMLATVNAEGMPNVSYAPFALREDGYYILISELARHTQNLLANPVVSLMMVEDEQDCRTLFARRRLTFDACPERVERNTEAWQAGIAALTERHGDTVTGLTGLGDFHLFRLVPVQGLFVKGFGQAFAVSGDDLVNVQPLTGGHRPLVAGKRG